MSETRELLRLTAKVNAIALILNEGETKKEKKLSKITFEELAEKIKEDISSLEITIRMQKKSQEENNIYGIKMKYYVKSEIEIIRNNLINLRKKLNSDNEIHTLAYKDVTDYFNSIIKLYISQSKNSDVNIANIEKFSETKVKDTIDDSDDELSIRDTSSRKQQKKSEINKEIKIDIGRPKEELTSDHKIMIQNINNETKTQDNILAEIEIGVDELYRKALDIGDELQLQEKMLSDLDKKTDKTENNIDATNNRLNRISIEVNTNPMRFCCGAIIIVILLVIMSIVINNQMK